MIGPAVTRRGPIWLSGVRGDATDRWQVELDKCKDCKAAVCNYECMWEDALFCLSWNATQEPICNRINLRSHDEHEAKTKTIHT